MFSERLEYGKYDFQHLQDALRCVYGHQKSDVLRVYNEDQSGWGQMVAYCLPQMSIAKFFRRAVKKIVDEKL